MTAKRPRDLVRLTSIDRQVVEISSDEDKNAPPPLKRHKSITPKDGQSTRNKRQPAKAAISRGFSANISSDHSQLVLHTLSNNTTTTAQTRPPLNGFRSHYLPRLNERGPHGSNISSIKTESQAKSLDNVDPILVSKSDVRQIGSDTGKSSQSRSRSSTHLQHSGEDGSETASSNDNEFQILQDFTRKVPGEKKTPNSDEIAQGQTFSNVPSSSRNLSRVQSARRPSPTSAKTNGPSHAAAAFSSPSKAKNFTLEVTLSQDLAPAHLRSDYLDRKRNVLKQLKRDDQPTEGLLTQVHEYYGQTGFSAAFGTDDTERYRRAAPKQSRQIDAGQVDIDWGNPMSAIDENAFDLSSLIHPLEQVKAVLTARFNEGYDPSITFSNTLNNRRLNGKFQFVEQYLIGPGIRPVPLRADSGCHCIGGCRFESCSCLVKETAKGIYEPIETYTIDQKTGKTLLSRTYIASQLDPAIGGIEITECNEKCGCGPDCWNCVVQRGRTAPLEIFETARCGFGVRSSKDILEGEFIDLYLGEILTQSELEKREDAKEEGAPSYVFSLDFFTPKGSLPYHVDGENFGTAMRFVNHSCNPNARSFTVVKNKNDKTIHYLAFFAIKDIQAGEEICIDYQNSGPIDVTGSQGQDSQGEAENRDEEDKTRCHCGAARCKKWLWPAKVRKRKKRKVMKND